VINIKQELEDSLAKEFEFMNQFTRFDSSHSRFSIECEHGDGWYNLIYNLCKKIKEELEMYPDNEFQILQIKEKYGFLCIYATNIPTSPFISTSIFDYIYETEIKSKNICEICGEKGKMRYDKNWFRVRCDKC